MAEVTTLPTNPEPLAVEPAKEIDVQVDLGSLISHDNQPLESKIGPDTLSSSESVSKFCLELGSSAIQILVNELFNLPSTPDKYGRLVHLPSVKTRLPREKPIPKPKPMTKWEKFAQSKGIVKRKRSKLEYDENEKEWRRRYGYKRVNDENDIQIIEAKSTDDVGSDPFADMKAEKKARIAKQEKSQLKNLKNAYKEKGKSVLPSTVQLSAVSLPIFGDKDKVAPKVGKESLGHVAGLASSATASIGKFDKKVDGEKPMKHVGKHRKFLPVVEKKGKESFEKKQVHEIMDKVIAKYDTDILNVDKAVRAYNKTEDSKRAEKNLQENSAKKGGIGGKRNRGGGQKSKPSKSKRSKK